MSLGPYDPKDVDRRFRRMERQALLGMTGCAGLMVTLFAFGVWLICSAICGEFILL